MFNLIRLRVDQVFGQLQPTIRFGVWGVWSIRLVW